MNLNEKIKAFFLGFGAAIIAFVSFLLGNLLSNKREPASGAGDELERKREAISGISRRDEEIYSEIRSQKLEK